MVQASLCSSSVFFSFTKVAMSVWWHQDRKHVMGCLTLQRCSNQVQLRGNQHVLCCACLSAFLMSQCLQAGWEIPAAAARCCCSLSSGLFSRKLAILSRPEHPLIRIEKLLSCFSGLAVKCCLTSSTVLNSSALVFTVQWFSYWRLHDSNRFLVPVWCFWRF